MATFSWNTREHLEAYLAVPCMGAVLHTLNVRLFADQLEYVVGHAEDRVILVEDSLVPVLEKLAPRFDTVRHYVVIGDGDAGSLPDPLRYEELLAAQEPGYDYPELDDRQAAGLCYTSGTTGNPKGVLYSHRSNVLHAMGQCMADSIGMRSDDRVMPVVPMFHANAWGIPYALGPHRRRPGDAGPRPERPGARRADRGRARDALRRRADDLDGPAAPRGRAFARPVEPAARDLRRLGRAAQPDAAVRGAPRRADPAGLGHDRDEPARLGRPARRRLWRRRSDWRYRSTQGRPASLVEARLVRDGGEDVPWDGKSTGELEVRGPWVARRYYGDDAGEEKFDDGWLTHR